MDAEFRVMGFVVMISAVSHGYAARTRTGMCWVVMSFRVCFTTAISPASYQILLNVVRYHLRLRRDLACIL